MSLARGLPPNPAGDEQGALGNEFETTRRRHRRAPRKQHTILIPKIDIWDAGTGHATSIKSINLMDKSYQDANALSSRINGYTNDLARFHGDQKGGLTITANENQEPRTLRLRYRP
ncbi:hypothetical protein ACFFX1_42660 [Dactylosporangium sucinum]|uniref:endonuclease toxin domain-containing protein n=1 Tax=Dactylosporangium sucinum TaxID=1424081 RepID=UPI003570A40B